MTKEELLDLLIISEKYFTGEKYQTLVSLARRMFETKNLSASEEVLLSLPTSDQLLTELVSKLKGKSIYRTLKKIHENKEVSTLVKLKGLSSLITHTIIEMESGRSEFGMLLPMLLEKENELLYDL